MKKLLATIISSSIICFSFGQTITPKEWRFRSMTCSPPSSWTLSSTNWDFTYEISVLLGQSGYQEHALDFTEAYWDVAANSGTSLSKRIEYVWGGSFAETGGAIGYLDCSDAGVTSTGGEFSDPSVLRGYVRLTTPLIGNSSKVGVLSMRTGGIYQSTDVSVGQTADNYSQTQLSIISDSTTLKPIDGDIDIIGVSGDLACHAVTLSLPRTFGGLRAPEEIATLLGTEGSVNGYTGLANGTYTVTLRARSCTRRVITVTVTSSGITLDSNDAYLYAGDFNEDNTINTDDYLIISDMIGDDHESTDYDWDIPNSCGIKPRDLDLNCDGFVNTDDYSIMSDNFDESGN